MGSSCLVWFRKSLRVHDNPALLHASKSHAKVYPCFILDPHFLKNTSYKCSVNRYNFLLESLTALDASLQKLGSRLLVLRGKPDEVLPRVLSDWGVQELLFEVDTEPYALMRDGGIEQMASNRGVKVTSFVSHTLFDHKEILKQGGGKAPLTYASFIKIVDKLKVPEPVATPASLPSIDNSLLSGMETSVPNWQEVGFTSPPTTPFKGGEDEGLRRMEEKLQNKQWIASFEKPNTDPSAFLVPSTTCLSAYLKFGCLSSRLFHSRLVQVYRESKGHSQPPVSLRGQLLWREFFYCVGAATGPSFSRMEGNPICRQIEWDENEDHLQLWKEGKTGYPWIDAIMRQLKEWGWCHHLARHSVACFLTRGDLYLSWEKGLAHFEEHLIDQDHYINSGNWMWLSASAFFNQYWKVYSPVAFGKKYDPSGAFIRRFVPELARFPDKYIYEPHTAPLAVQKAASCIIGEDYPKPMVDHSVVSKSCISRMAAAYKLSRGEVGDEDQAATAGKGKGKREAAPTSKASSSKKNQKTLEESGFVTSKKKD